MSLLIQASFRLQTHSMSFDIKPNIGRGHARVYAEMPPVAPSTKTATLGHTGLNFGEKHTHTHTHTIKGDARAGIGSFTLGLNLAPQVTDCSHLFAGLPPVTLSAAKATLGHTETAAGAIGIFRCRQDVIAQHI